jgi:hypothetical protein
MDLGKVDFNVQLSRESLKAVEALDGWLAEPDALLIDFLLKVQDSLGISGPILEIGVHRGRFLGFLRAVSEEMLVGVQLVDQQYAEHFETTTLQNIKNCIGRSHGISFIVSDSTKLVTADLIDKAGGDVRLVHVDGGHDYDTVSHDLCLVEPTLCQGGLLVVDDVFNRIVPGVAQASAEFFASSVRLRPFAIGFNKVFATTEQFADIYRKATEYHLDKYAQTGVKNRSQDLHKRHVELGFSPNYCGSDVVVFI